MKEKIKKDVLELFKEKNIDSNFNLEEITDVIIDKTTDALLEEIRNELENEFKTGNLNQPLTISDEYYLHLKLTDIKNKCLSKPKKNIVETINEVKEEI
jgi:hypothetical protein